MTAEEAKKYGLVDQVVKSRKEVPKPVLEGVDAKND
jgi:ATP-dependent protease ClpP protease subunit